MSLVGRSIALGPLFTLSLNCSRSDQTDVLGRSRNCSWLVSVNCSWLSAPRTASGLRQNLSTNRLRTCLWPSTRITLDHLATTRSFTLGKLLALLGNSRPPLPRAAMVGWSWCWRPKSHVGCVQATLFSRRYDGPSGGFVERELQLLLHHHRIKKGVDLQVVSLASLCPSIWLDWQRLYERRRNSPFWKASANLIQGMVARWDL